MRERYGASPRSQMLKYLNDIRTTLQALYALFDNCNSLRDLVEPGNTPTHVGKTYV